MPPEPVPSKSKRDERGDVRVLHSASRVACKPCPSRVAGPFIGTDARQLRCGGEREHDGPHYFHVEWTEARNG